jgi:hypothetical protein
MPTAQAVDIAVEVTQLGVAPFYYDLSLVLECGGGVVKSTLPGVDDILDRGQSKTFTFKNIPATKECLGQISLSLHSSYAYPGRPIRFAQGTSGTGKVLLQIPLSTSPPLPIPLPPVQSVTKAPTKIPLKSPTQAPMKPPTKLPIKPPTKLPVKPPTKVPTKAPTAKAPAMLPIALDCSISWNLYDSQTDSLVARLANGTTIPSPPPCGKTNIEAFLPCGTSGSVFIELRQGTKVVQSRYENSAKYFLFGNIGNDALDGKIPAGSYSIRATSSGIVGPATTFILGGKCL